MITFNIITIFPKIFDSYFNESILKRAQAKKLVKIKIWNLRDFTPKPKAGAPAAKSGLGAKRFRKVDDKPYGGGAGMIIMAEPILRAVEHITKKDKSKRTKIVVFSAKGKPFNQKLAYDWSKKFDQIVLVSGRYEGIDERVFRILKAEEISIGPYVLTDGEVPAMAVVSAVTRLIPGVIKLESLKEESHWNLLLKKKEAAGTKGVEYPHYTRPEILTYKRRKYPVPKVLLSGNHKSIEDWRKSFDASTRAQHQS